MAMLLRQSEISSPAYKMRKIVTTSSTNQGTPVNTTASTYQRALKHSTGSRIVGIPKHLRKAMKLRRTEQERIKGDEKSGAVKVTEDDDNEPYRVSQTSLSVSRHGDASRRLMPPHHPKLKPYRRVDSPGSSAAPTPSRSRFMQQKQNRKAMPLVNSNKRTRTGLSPALRALGFDDGDKAILPPDIRRNKTLPPELCLDGDVEVSGDETTGKDMKYSQSSSDEEEEVAGDAEDALNPMMLADNGQDSGEDTHSSDGATDDEDGEEAILNPAFVTTGDDQSVSFMFRRSSAENSNVEDGVSIAGMERSSSWSYLVSPMLSASSAPSKSSVFLSSSPANELPQELPQYGGFNDLLDNNEIDDFTL